MAATVEDIVSLAEVKRELRSPPADVSQDQHFRDISAWAVDKVASDTGRPLLDLPHTAFAEIPDDDDRPLEINVRDFYFDDSNTAHEIDYWTSKGGGLSEPPDGSISRGDVGRTVRSDDGANYFIYTDMAWPADALPGSKARIKGSLEVPAVPGGLKQAIIVLIRHIHKGGEKPPANYKWMLQPYRRLVPR